MYQLLSGLSVIEASSFVASPSAGLYCAARRRGDGEAIAKLEIERSVSFATDDGLRFAHREALFPLFEAAIAARTHAELAAAWDAAGVVHSAYSTLLDAARDPRLVMNNPIFGAARNPSGFGYPAVGAFATIPQLPRGPPRPAPRNGQHSEEVLSERLGLSSADVARLTDRGVVGVSRG